MNMKYIFMNIRRFDLKTDRKYAVELMLKRGLNLNLLNDLPQLGLIALDLPTPGAMGFLRRMEGDQYIFDSLITNPDLEPEVRDVLLDKLVTELVALASSQAITKILAYTVDNNVIERAKKHGFEVLPHTVLSLDRGSK